MKTFSEFPYKPGRKSPKVDTAMAAKIKALLKHGLTQQDIASICGINQGRVSEIKTGKAYLEVEPSQLELRFD